MKLVSAASPRADARRELVSLHQRLFRRQRRSIEAILGPEGPDLARYRRRYQSAVRHFEEVVPYDEVVAAAEKGRCVLVGDYHTLRQSQRSYQKLAERLLSRSVRPLLAVEFVQGRYQAAVDAFLAGSLDESAFLAAVRYQALQPFDLWPHFRPLFELARREHLPVVALDSPGGGPGSLAARDAFAGRALALALRSHPDRLPLVLVGQLHLAPQHLPAALPPWAREGLVTLYQNCEEIYFELERRGLEQTAEAVRISAHAYCLLSASPVVAQQSYLDFVEATAQGEGVEVVTPEAHFRSAGRLLSEFLTIDPPQPFDDVEVVTLGNFSLLKRLQRSNPREFRVIAQRIVLGDSFTLPGLRSVYLAGASLNRAAEVAARYLWHVCADEDGEARGLVDAFYAETLEQAMGFFGSKVVNPHRKAVHRGRWLQRLEHGGPAAEVAAAVLAHQRFERGERAPEVQRLYTLKDAERFRAITRGLGQVLGDKLYHALLAGRIGKAEIRSLFFDPFDDEGAALHTYLYLIGKVGRTRVPLRRA